MGHITMLHLKLKKFFSIKILIWDWLGSDDNKITSFSFDQLDEVSLCLCNLLGKEQLAVRPLDDFSAEKSSSLVIQLILSPKVSLWELLQRELLETLGNWPSGTFAALSEKE